MDGVDIFLEKFLAASNKKLMVECNIFDELSSVLLVSEVKVLLLKSSSSSATTAHSLLSSSSGSSGDSGGGRDECVARMRAMEEELREMKLERQLRSFPSTPSATRSSTAIPSSSSSREDEKRIGRERGEVREEKGGGSFQTPTSSFFHPCFFHPPSSPFIRISSHHLFFCCQ